MAMNSLLGFGNPYSDQMTTLLGLDPAEMRRQALWRGLQQAGIGLMTGGTVGDAFKGFSEGADEAKSQYTEQAMLGYKMSQAEQERAAKEAEREQFNSYISTLPPDLQPAIRANPGLMDDYVKATNPAFQQPADPLDIEYKKAQIENLRRQGTGGVNAPSGYRYTEDGNLAFIPGGPADPAAKRVTDKPTEADERAKLLAGQSKTQEKTVMDTFDSLADPQNSAGRMLPGGRAIMTPQGQQAQDSISNVIANWIYLVSGATATEQEVQRRTQEVMPTYWDDPTTKAQKKARLKSYFTEMYERAGIPSIDAPSGAGGAEDPLGLR